MALGNGWPIFAQGLESGSGATVILLLSDSERSGAAATHTLSMISNIVIDHLIGMGSTGIHSNS